MSLGGVELVGGQQVVHGVAPAAPIHEPHGGATCRVDAAHRLELGETAVVGGHHDVTGQHQLDPESECHALHGGHDRFAAPTAQRHRIDPTTGGAATLLHSGVELWQVQAGGEVGSMAK